MNGGRPAPGVCEMWTAAAPPGPQAAAASLALQRLVVARAVGAAAARAAPERRCARCGGSGHGRPYAPGAGFDYSVAHSGGLLVVAAVGAGRVGVDVELRRRRFDVVPLARLVCCAAEQRWLADLDAAARGPAVVRLWVRKEAVLKLLGLGMNGPWSQLDVRGPVVRLGRAAAARRVYLTTVPPALLGPAAGDACAAVATSRPVSSIVGRSPDPDAAPGD